MTDKTNQLKVGFGDTITFTQAVKGMLGETTRGGTTRRDVFEYAPRKLQGIVIGKRQLQEGIIFHGSKGSFLTYLESDPAEFRVENRVHVYLVAIDMRSKPIYVRPEDIITVIHQA